MLKIKNNSLYIYDDSSKGYIKFEYDNKLGVICSFHFTDNKNNNSDFYVYTNINQSELLNINNFLYKNNVNDYSTLELSHINDNKIIVGCSCVGGVTEHNIIIGLDGYDNNIDDNTNNVDNVRIEIKLNLYDKNDSIILSKQHTDFIINFLTKYAR